MRATTLLALILVAVFGSCRNSLENCDQSIPAAALPHPASPPSAPGVHAPGPVPLRSVEQLHQYLCSAEFRRDENWWRFASDGSYSAELDGIPSGGRWTTTSEGLWLTDYRGAEVTTLPMQWLDGKYRIDIDGVQYMRDWDLIRDRPRESGQGD